MVTAVKAIYRETFQPELGPEPKVVTLTDKGQDILVVRWTGRNARDAFSELIVPSRCAVSLRRFVLATARCGERSLGHF
jgi:hypothetical protein